MSHVVIFSSTAYLSFAAITIYFSLFALSGLVIYAYYEGCDPISSGRVTEADQVGVVEFLFFALLFPL
jgi:hypothetical protein